MIWMPKQVYFEKGASDTVVGRRVWDFCQMHKIPTKNTTTNGQIRDLDGDTEAERFALAKRTLLVGRKKSMKLDVCKPSADFSFPLVTNCAGLCEYCYLYSTQGDKPVMRAYVNTDEIFQTIQDTIKNRMPESTTFEVASSGDPLSIEHITGTLKDAIEFFSKLEHTHLRLVTKFDEVDSLTKINHNEHTTIRFSINADFVIRQYEHRTAPLEGRLEAARKVADAGYPFGFIVAPIMVFPEYLEAYTKLFEDTAKILGDIRNHPMTFELIQHRFTAKGKTNILARYPQSKLDMDEEKRVKKFGKFGMTKYVYPKEVADEMKSHLTHQIERLFPQAKVLYFT